VIAGYNIINPSIPFDQVHKYTDISKASTHSWWWNAIDYGGIILANSFSFLTIVGSEAMSHKTARRGAYIGGFVFSLL
ncbi:hypothetical protein WL230_12920, partial [Staphylococcus epidermidis]